MLDAMIIGGGAAGLTAALYLGRFRRKVVVFDTGKQANRFSHAAHGLFTRDGTPPSELVAIGREQLERYETVEIQSKAVQTIRQENGHFVAVLEDGSEISSRKVLLATGLKDNLPAIEGIQEFWGKSIFHCPYCDGWEVREQAVGIIGDGKTGLHLAKLLRVLTQDLVLCTNGESELSEEEREALHKQGVKIIESPISRFEGEGHQLHTIVFADGQKLARTAIFVRLTTVHQSPFAAQLGCKMSKEDLVEVDEFGRSSVAGVYAAGDIAHRMRQLLIAAAQGATAAIGINHDLIEEVFE